VPPVGDSARDMYYFSQALVEMKIPNPPVLISAAARKKQRGVSWLRFGGRQITYRMKLLFYKFCMKKQFI
jgi:hypothetical protein